MAEFDTIVKRLRAAYAAGVDNHVKAATELLIWHEHWLRRADFAKLCVKSTGPSTACLAWKHARVFYDAMPSGSTSQIAVLDLAIALGEDRYRFGIMGHAHRRSIGNAVWAALGLAELAIPDSGPHGGKPDAPDHPVTHLVTMHFGLSSPIPIHLVRGTERGTPGPTLCGIDRFRKDGPGWGLGDGVTGPGIFQAPCPDCLAVARDQFPGLTIDGGIAAKGFGELLGVPSMSDISLPRKRGHSGG